MKGTLSAQYTRSNPIWKRYAVIFVPL